MRTPARRCSALVDLVGQNAQADAALGEGSQRLFHMRVGLRQLVPDDGIELHPAAHGGLGLLGRSIGGHGLVHERAGSVAHEAVDLVGRAAGEALLVQGGVRQNHQVGQRIEKRAVKVEHKGIETSHVNLLAK